ncbi:transposase IS66 family protein [Escherichia coli P0305260.12]|nr:transposase IS66 family protein [Escherichia coli P0305260.12]
MRNCNVCSSVKAQKNFVQKPNGRYRKHRSESAHFRKKWRKRWVSNMTRYCHPPCASLQPVNRYRPHFPVKPGLSGRKRNAVLPVVVNSVLWDVMCQSNWSLSAAPLRLSKHNVRNGLLPVRPYRAGPSFKTHCTQLCRSGASGPCCPGKYADHLPLYRQSEIYRRQGVELSRATLGRWTGAVAELLEPLYDVLRQYVLMPGKVHADDIPVPVQEPGSGKTRTARLWVYVRDDRNAGSQMPPAVWFAYSPDRKGIHPQNHLAGYSGVLQADAYGGYRALYESGRITEAACMAHARRKIHDVHARVPTDITTEALRRIGELYVIEAEVRGCSAEQRLAARKARAAPLMQSLYDWIQTQMKTLSRHSDTAKAFAYLLKQWEALNVYCSNGWEEIDNNIAENALRGVAVGRKNWLFAGSDSGGEHAAVLYSLIGTCRLNNVEPEKWLHYVIEHIQDWPTNRVRDLLPWKVDLTSQ